MANPQTWTDPNTGEEYELVADTAPVQKTWKDPKTGEEYELVPDTPVQNAPKSPTISEGLAAGYRTAKDEIPYVQSRTKEGAYMDLARKLGKNLVTDYFSPKALIPGRDVFGVDSYDYDKLFNDAKKAGLVNDNDRASFEQNLLSRSGAREEDLSTTAQAPISGFIGGIGSLVNDPLNVGAGIALGPISKGMGLAKGMLTEGLANAGTELAQLPFTNEAIKALGEDLSPEEMAARVAMAGGFGAGLHGLFRSLGIGDRVDTEPTVRTEETPAVEGAAPAATREWTDEEMLGITKMIKNGGTVDDIAKVYPLTQEQRDAIGWHVEANKKGRDGKVYFENGDKTQIGAIPRPEEDVPFEAPDFLNQSAKRPHTRAAEKVEAPKVEQAAEAPKIPEGPKPRVTVDETVNHINETVPHGKNVPKHHVARNVDELPPEIRQSVIEDGAEDAAGFVRNGEVYVLSDNLRDLDHATAVIYHEWLGHVGLWRLFRQRLDKVMEQMYKTNQMVRDAADQWLQHNTTQHPNPIAHAVEEILAETSENGKIDARLFEKIKAFLKQYARRIPGLKNLKYTDKEVFAILSMAHQKAIDGGRSGRRSGNLYMRMFNASNDNRVSLRDRPHFPINGTREEVTQYYKDRVKYLQARANQAIEDGRPEKAARYEAEARADQNLIAVREGTSTPKSNAEYYREQAEYYESKAKSWFDRGRAKTGLLYQKEAAEARANAAKYAERAITNKYSKPDAEGGRTRGLRLDKIVTKDDEASAKFIKELQKELPDKYTQSWEETEAMAERIGMNINKLEKMADGIKPEHIKAAEVFVIGKLNMITDLQKKLDGNKWTLKDRDNLIVQTRQFVEALKALEDIKSAQGRNLNILRTMTINNKAGTNKVRYALAQAEKNGLSDVESMKQLANAIDELKKNPKGAAERGYSKAYEYFMDVINIPRTIMSSMDMSAPFRQGINLIARKEFWKAYASMFKYAVSEKAYKGMLDEIQSRPTYEAMKNAKLFIADVGDAITDREEAFLSKLAARLPGIHASERAYNGFLNKLRADTFDTIYKNGIKAGADLSEDSKALRDLGSFINNATGRGSIKHIDQSMPILSAMFFSPKLIASRVQMLNPFYYAQLSPVVRKEALKSAMSLGAIAMTIGALAQSAGADVESDPRSSDFMKIKTGDTRYDILGGYGQYITLASRLMTNEKKTTAGVVKKYGTKFGEENRLDAIEKFFENKFSPVASFVADYYRGTDAVGKEFKMDEAITKRMIPLYLQDAYEIMQEEGTGKGALMAAPGLFGIGTQTYKDERGGFEMKDRSTDDPALQEIQRLGGDKDIVTTGNKTDAKTLGIPELDEKQLKTYRDYSSQLISAAVKEAMATPEWKEASDEEKVKWVKQIGKDMRLMAREDLFGSNDDEEEQPWDEYNDEE